MTLFDFTIVALIFVSVGFAVFRGGLAEIATLFSMAIGATTGLFSAQPLAGALGRSGSTMTILMVGVVVAVVVFAICVAGTSLFLRRVRLNERHEIIDRAVGGFLGLFRALALVGVAFLGYAYYLEEAKRPPVVANALLEPLADGLANVITGFAPNRRPLELENSVPKNSSFRRDNESNNVPAPVQ
ncbi:MAG: CvpA family protein [Pseudomonadota bacterium]